MHIETESNLGRAPGELVWRAPALSVIVPTYNELRNVEPLVDAISKVLPPGRFEVVFVDDNSPDGTAAQAKRLSNQGYPVRCIHRIGRRGLSSAVVEGVLSSSAEFVAVIDGDMQHDERLLPLMLQQLEDGTADLVVGSRYVEGGSIGDWTASRAWMSRIAGSLSRAVLRGRTLTDPMSGFFMTRRASFDSVVPKLSVQGFKILLDYVASNDESSVRISELPYQFRNRQFGESKLDSLVLWEYGILLLDKLSGGRIPARFILFGAVGASGLVVHLSVLKASFGLLGLSFSRAQTIATFVAMTWNFVLNDTLTYRDKRLKGLKWLKGLFTFFAVCSLGAFANIGIASALFDQHYRWWLAALAGVLIGTVFNYAMTSVFTWRR